MIDFLMIFGLLTTARFVMATTGSESMSDWRTSLSAPTCPSTPLLSQISCYDPWSSSRLPDVQRNQSEPISSREPPKTPPSKDEWTGGSRCAGEYCLYANRAFGGERGIVVITTAHGLEKVKAIAGRAAAKTLEDEGDSHSSLPSGPSPFYVEEVSGKGLGMLASRALRRGDVVLTRVPALLAHRNFMERTPREERERLLGLVLSLLPAATRRSFVRQAGRFGGHEVADIVTTNSFQVDLGGDGTGSSAGHHYANFPEVSRFNHDCRPNAVFFVDADLVHRTTVVRDVAPGEELTISYLDSMAPRAERQHRARVAWGFECTCAQCGLTDETAVAASDGRLAEIAELEGRLSDVKSEVTLDTVDRYVRLFAEEKLEAKLAGAYTTAALNYNLLGKSGLAVKYARLAIEAGMIEDGPAAPDVEAMRVLARDPKKHFTWRARLGK